MAEYTILSVEDVPDASGGYPGEMHFFTGPLETEQVALTFRRMPPQTGGKGSYGHSHKTQEELVFVISGNLQFKIGDEVIEVGPAARRASRAQRGSLDLERQRRRRGDHHRLDPPRERPRRRRAARGLLARGVVRRRHRITTRVVLRSEERVTPLELFFDLVFVLALTQCTALMAKHPTWEGSSRAS